MTNMDSGYLKKARLECNKSKISEVSMLNNNPNIMDSLQAVIELKKKINEEKMQALKEIDAKYFDELQDLESNYGMLLMCSI